MEKTNILVKFRIVGDNFEHDKITSVLGIAPTEAWNIGDKYIRSGKQHRKTYTCWGLSTGYKESLYISVQLHEIINSLISKKEKLMELKRIYELDYKLDAVINIENSEAPALNIDTKVIAFANAIGAELDIDLYIMS